MEVTFQNETLKIDQSLYELISKCCDVSKDLGVHGIQFSSFQLLNDIFCRKGFSLSCGNIYQLQELCNVFHIDYLNSMIQNFLKSVPPHYLYIPLYLFQVATDKPTNESSQTIVSEFEKLVNQPLVTKLPFSLLENGLKTHQNLTENDIFNLALNYYRGTGNTELIKFINTKSLTRRQFEILRTIPNSGIEETNQNRPIGELVEVNERQLKETLAFYEQISSQVQDEALDEVNTKIEGVDHSLEKEITTIQKKLGHGKANLQQLLTQIEEMEAKLVGIDNEMKEDDISIQVLRRQIEAVDSGIKETQETMRVLPK